MAQITAVVLTLNEAEHITDCLASLSWADASLVLDSHSTDTTAELAQQAGAQVAQAPFQNYAAQRNIALDLLANSHPTWVFFVDADERCTPELAQEIRHVTQNNPEVGWHVPRHNYIFGQLTQHAGWYPDYQARLFVHGRVRYERPVHEIATVNGQMGYLTHPLIHYNYKTIPQFHYKQKAYAQHEANILRQQGHQPKFYTPYTQALRQFRWRWLTLNGYKMGWHGLRLSLYMAYYEYLKYTHIKH